MSISTVERFKVRAKLLVKAKKKSGTPFRLKDALDTIARASGFASWRELRNASHGEDLYSRSTGVFLNHWCKTYAEACDVLKKHGGVLFPYGKQFFVSPVEHLEGLGISRDDADLALVGNDWVQPKNREAFNRLNERIRKRELR